MATNSNNNLTKNNSALSKSLEKLSSGFRINRAADDASGLAISEKMKAQIKALDTASANCEDGISLIQTAEGYMTEIHDMLNRMVELAEKSANGTMETVSGGTSAEVYSGAATDRQALQEEMDQLCAEIDRIAQTANFNNLKLFDGTLAGLTLQIGETDTAADKLVVNVAQLTTDKLFDKIAEGTTYTGTGTGLELTQNNATSTYDEGLTVNISNQDAASSAAVGLRNSINAVSSQRAKLGAMQNRMEYTINNLNTASENMNSANSRIRDTDMAKEMMKYTQSNVLTQAAQAMLAQANTQPQNVLQLLQ
jgi:flagellin